MGILNNIVSTVCDVSRVCHEPYRPLVDSRQHHNVVSAMPGALLILQSAQVRRAVFIIASHDDRRRHGFLWTTLLISSRLMLSLCYPIPG